MPLQGAGVRVCFSGFLLILSSASLRAAEVSYQREVRPILEERCVLCHRGGGAGAAGVSLASPDAVRKLAATGRLIAVVSGDKPRMPKAGDPLTAPQIAILKRWVDEGAKDDTTGAPEDTTWWSLRSLPENRPGSIDAFIRETLKSRGLNPSAEADRRTLIRRVSFDLHGLPPTLAEIEAFEKDSRPDAYERLVDRLLASPRYGERWARHWLDVAHYGDTHGYDKDKPRPNAWPYRDYVIRALNEDKPYARFIREQIAGDVLYPESPEAFVGTGFLAAGPWDLVGHQELREGTVDKDNTRLLDRDDMVATTMSTFTSMTAHCARCHNHKFDPIPQQDYYNLQAVFAGVDRADRPWDEDAAVHQKRQELMRRKMAIQQRLQPLLDKVEFASTPEIVELDASIQDAKLLMVHMGTPKTKAEEEEKAGLQARVERDQKRRKEIVDSLVGAETYAAIDRIRAEFAPVDAELARLPAPKQVYSGATYFQRAGAFRPPLGPRPVHVLARGSVQSPGKEAVPGALSCVPGLNASFATSTAEGERRAALANWIADERNVLTWRSIVNRVWHYHFGQGIVDSPSDFGRMGSKPTHPELLDWLAAWFRDEAKGSLKQLHRAIMLSATYRQSSAQRADAAAIDADNRYLWRMNRTRLDAEAVRDSVLSAAGKLDLTMGGPGVRMFFFKDDHSPVYDYSRFAPDEPGAYRRSIYRFIVRSVPDPFMERLDCPDPSVLTPKRTTTITAIQALATLNNPFMIRMAEHLAERAKSAEEAVRLALGRAATPDESREYGAYASRHGLVNLCRLLFNTNEFLFVD